MNRRRLVALAALVMATLPIPRAIAACHEASFPDDPYSVGESAGKVTITVSNNGGAGVGSIDYKTKNGSAKASKDYQAKSGTLAFAPGTSELSFDVPILNDGDDEQNETFTVELSNPQGCFSTISEPSATVTIQDNDEKPIPLPSVIHSPTPTKTAKPKPKPSTASPSPSPTLSPSPTDTASPIAAPAAGDGGLSGGALAGIVAGTLGVGGAAAFWVRRRFLG